MLLISIYQISISPFLGECCRFYPSCSHYMQAAISRFGILKGLWLGFCRLGKCHPWHPGGIDYIPEQKKR